jgi:hypothetical protein
MGPDGAIRSKTRAVRAPINPSVSKGCTEAEPSCSASASSSRPDGRRNRPARLLQRRRLPHNRSHMGLEQVDHAAAGQGMGRIWSACSHTRPGWSFRIHSENTRCVTGVRRRGHPHFPVRKISRHSNGEPVQSAAQGEHAVVGVVQHFGGWRLLSEGLGRCPRRASSGFHPKRQTPFRVKEEREDGVAFSAPEKPPDACTPAARRDGRVAAQGCAATLEETKAMSTDVYERTKSPIANELESGARLRLRPGNAAHAKERITHRLRDQQGGRQGVSHAAA